MSRVLLLLPSLPFPADAGAKIRNRGLLELLSQDHDVEAMAFGDSLDRRMTTVPPPGARSMVRRALDLAGSDLPDMAHRLWSQAFVDALQCRLSERHYDLVQAEGIEMARYLGLVPANRRAYDAHNAEFLLQRRLASSGSVAGRLYSRVQWRRLERFERGIVKGTRLTLAVSHHDANQLLALAPGDANVRVVPNGIDVAAYPFLPPGAETPPNLLFVGKLDFRPNAGAVRWFLDGVLDRVNQARLFAVGAAPPQWLIEAGQHDDRIAVTGYVEDEAPYFARCLALVLPLQTGGGSRLKALIAMARGLPIVSTRVGMEGIEAEPERDFLLADHPADWAAALSRLVDEPDLRTRLAANGRALVERRYDWPVLRADVRAAYASIGL